MNSTKHFVLICFFLLPIKGCKKTNRPHTGQTKQTKRDFKTECGKYHEHFCLSITIENLHPGKTFDLRSRKKYFLAKAAFPS